MKPILKFLIAASSLVFLSSCEDVVQVKLDEGSKLYVIDAFVNNLPGVQTIKVVTNDNYFSGREAPPVTNASVVLKDLTDNKQYVFNYSTNGKYVFNPIITDTLGKVDHQYELNVTIDGQTYTSLVVQKRTARIDSISATLNDGGGFGPPSTTEYLCYLYARDRVDKNTDYYWVKTYRNDTLFFGPNDINLCIDGTGGPVTDAGPIDTLDFTPPSTFLGFKTFRKGDICKAEIHSISRDTYFFFTQASAQINNGGLFATTPENVRTNIVTPSGAKTKAVGWFNMATVSSATKLVQ